MSNTTYNSMHTSNKWATKTWFSCNANEEKSLIKKKQYIQHTSS